MKKSLVFLGIILGSFSSVAMAAVPSVSPTRIENATFRAGTPLCMAISKGDVETVRKFIEYGANVNEESNGMTPLMIAARYNNVAIIKLLIENGADQTVVNGNGFNALKLAKLSNATEAANYLETAVSRN